MRRRRVGVEMAFLDVLPMVSFRTGEPKQTFLQDVVSTIPKREREAKAAFAIRNPEQPVFTPPVSSAPRMFMRKIFPWILLLRIIFADGGPLTFGEVRPPPFPVFGPGLVFFQTLNVLIHM